MEYRDRSTTRRSPKRPDGKDGAQPVVQLDAGQHHEVKVYQVGNVFDANELGRVSAS